MEFVKGCRNSFAGFFKRNSRNSSLVVFVGKTALLDVGPTRLPGDSWATH